MQQFRVIEVFSTFSKDDVKKFSEYLNSPFFNKSAKLIRLYESLIVFHPEFNSKHLNEKRIFKLVNPDLSFNISTLRNLLHELSNAANHYLAVINFNEKQFDIKDCLREELLKRNLKKLLEASILKSELLFRDVKEFDAIYFLNKYKLTNDIANFNITFKPRSGNAAVASAIQNLTEHGKNITHFFAKESNRVLDNLLTMKKTYDINEEDNFVFRLFKIIDFEKLFELISEGPDNDVISNLFKLQLAEYIAFSKMENDEYYYTFKKLMLKEIKYLSIDEIRHHTIKLLRYCMLKSESGDLKTADKFDKERFDIYNFILDYKYYKSSISSFLPVELYRTIILLSLKLKKYSWVYNFIKKFRSELPPDRRNNMYHYSCSEYYFCRGKYSEAMKSFHRVKLDHFMLKVDMKNLMLRTFYELDLFDNAISLIDTYKHFLTNDKTLSATEKRLNKNFMNVIHKMILYRISGKKTGKFRIEYELKRDFPHKKWVIEKFAQIDGKYVKSA